MKKPIPLLALLSALAPWPSSGEPIPPLINYQGSLPDPGPAGSSKRLTFNLYDSADASTPAWGPQHFDNVPVVNGRFDVILGTTDTVGRTLTDAVGSRERYLGVTVDGRELQPRQRILSALSNLSGAGVPGLPSAANDIPPAVAPIPPGTIVAMWSNRIPAGWLPCDGSQVPEGGAYDRLRELTGGRLPDLRGLFLRGLGQNADPAFRYAGDATRTLSQLQQDEFKHHAHPFDDYTFSENSGTAGNAWGQAGRSDIDNSPGSPFAHSTADAGGEETRPKNAAVYWIIKY